MAREKSRAAGLVRGFEFPLKIPTGVLSPPGRPPATAESEPRQRSAGVDSVPGILSISELWQTQGLNIAWRELSWAQLEPLCYSDRFFFMAIDRTTPCSITTGLPPKRPDEKLFQSCIPCP